MIIHFLKAITVKKYSQNANDFSELYSWLQSLVGRIGIITVAAAFVTYLFPHTMPFIVIAIIAFTFLPNQRWNLLLIATAYAWIFSNSIGWNQISFESTLIRNQYAYKILLIFINVAILFVIINWSRLKFFGWRHLIPLVILIYFVLIWYYLYNNTRTGIAYHSAIIFGYFIWFLIFALKFQHRIQKNIIHQIGSFAPFWHVFPTSLPFPHGTNYLEEVEAKSPLQLAKTQLSGLRLLFWATLLELAFLILVKLVYNPTNPLLPSLNLITKTKILADKSLAFSLISIVVGFISLGIKFISIWAGFIGIARLAGFNAFRGVYKPFSATSFNDFWSRIEHYYVRLNLLIFIVPFSKTAIRLKVKKQFRFIATILGTTACGLFFHFFRDFHVYGELSFNQIITMFSKNMFYYFLLGVLVSLNIRFRKSKPPPESLKEALLGYSKILVAFIIVFLGFYFHRTSFDNIMDGLIRFLGMEKL